MTTSPLVLDIARRLDAAGVSADPSVLDGCAAYLSLLARWNQRMNLTALPVTPPVPAATLDKLVVEPILAAELLPHDVEAWVDLGSGGGSPAVPLRLVNRDGRLVMVESKGRKCAFLREVVRQLALPDTAVESVRFEDFSPATPFDLVTVRAVKLDPGLIDLVTGWLAPGATLISFGSDPGDSRFRPEGQLVLPDGSLLMRFRYEPNR